METLDDVATRLGIDRATAYRRVIRGEIHGEYIGAKWLIPESELEREAMRVLTSRPIAVDGPLSPPRRRA